MRKFLMTFLVFCFALSASSVVSANGKSEVANAYIDPDTGEVIRAVYEMDYNGNLVEVPLEVYKEEMKKSSKATKELSKLSNVNNSEIVSNSYSNAEGTITPMAYNYYYYVFSNTASSTYYGNTLKVSNAINCNTTVPAGCPITTGWQETSTHTFSTNVNTTIKKDVVQAAAGYSYATSKTAMLSYTLPVPPGKFAYLGFKPKFKLQIGILQYWHQWGSNTTLVSSESANVSYPLKNSDGSTDGYYLLIDANTNQPL